MLNRSTDIACLNRFRNADREQLIASAKTLEDTQQPLLRLVQYETLDEWLPYLRKDDIVDCLNRVGVIFKKSSKVLSFNYLRACLTIL